MAVSKIPRPERAWKGYQSVTGTASIDISGLDIDELFVKVNIGSGSGENMTSITIPRTALGVSHEFYRLGGFQSSTNAQLTILRINRSSVACAYNWINGNDVSSTSIISVYYR